MPDDGIYVEDLTQVGYVGRMAFPVYQPRTYIHSGYQGTLGFGFATALGAKVGRPDRPVVSISGDGGFMYNVQELSTAVKHGIDIVAIVFADGAYGNVRRMQKEDYGNRLIGVDLHNPQFPEDGRKLWRRRGAHDDPRGSRPRACRGAEAARNDLDRGRGRRNARSLEGHVAAAGPRRPVAGDRCSTRRSSRRCAPNIRAPRKPRLRRPSSERRCRWCSAENYRRSMPFAGVSTLLDLPYRPEAPDLPDFGGLDVALVGVPMDLGVTNRAGARFGPRAVRDVERIGPYNHALGVAPRGECSAADIGDVPLRSRFSLDASIEDIAAFYASHPEGRGAAAFGRRRSLDHLSDPPGAWGSDRPVGLVHIDAHCDTMGEIDGSKFHHGGPFRQAVLAGVLDPERTIQIGIRGPAEVFWGFSYESGMTVLHIEDVDRLGIDAVVEKARAVVGDGPTYISFDVDGLDPAFTPGTGTPEAGGLTPREAQAILHGLAGHRHRRRRCRRGRPAIRPDQQYRDGRRPNAVRDLFADGPRPGFQAAVNIAPDAPTRALRLPRGRAWPGHPRVCIRPNA